MGQTRKLGSSLTDFEAVDATILMVIPHERCRTKWWADKIKGEYTILADPGFWVSSLYGVAFQMRIHSDTSNTPATFIIDKEGLLRWAHVGAGKRNYSDRPNVQQTLAKLKEFAK